MYQNSRPTNAELNLYKTYYHQPGFLKTTVSKSIQNVKKPQEKPEHTMLQKIKSQNLHKIEQMDILRFVNFSTEKGLKISFEKLFGLPTKWEKRYFQVLIESYFLCGHFIRRASWKSRVYREWLKF